MQKAAKKQSSPPARPDLIDDGPGSLDYRSVGGTALRYEARMAVLNHDVSIVRGGPNELFATPVLHAYGPKKDCEQTKRRWSKGLSLPFLTASAQTAWTSNCSRKAEVVVYAIERHCYTTRILAVHNPIAWICSKLEPLLYVTEA